MSLYHVGVSAELEEEARQAAISEEKLVKD